MTRMRSAVRGLRSVLIVMLLAGCRTPTDPAPLDGLFVLETVGGDPLPANSATQPGETVVAESLFFHSRMRRGRNAKIEQRTTAEYSSIGARRFTEMVEYRLNGASLTFPQPPCNDTNSCVWNGRTGVLNGDELVITYILPGLRQRVYRRVS